MNKYEEALDNIGSLYMYDEDGEADYIFSEWGERWWTKLQFVML